MTWSLEFRSVSLCRLCQEDVLALNVHVRSTVVGNHSQTLLVLILHMHQTASCHDSSFLSDASSDDVQMIDAASINHCSDD